MTSTWSRCEVAPVQTFGGARTSEAQAGLALLSIRFIQGFIFWGGGSRRFIYAPQKLDPDALSWMANKLQSAMPGALLGTDHAIAYLLQHFWLLYPAVILFSAAELVVGLALMTGSMTRASALISMGFAVALMLMFGWQGATCIDEWTMAVANLAMGATLALAGGGAYAADSYLLRRAPSLASRDWFRFCGGALPLPLGATPFRRIALAVFVAVAAFSVGTYSYYRGAVVGPYHKGPVSPAAHHLTLSDALLLPDGSVRVHAYLDGGTPAVPAHIVAAALVRADGEEAARWDMAALSRMAHDNVLNVFDYNRMTIGPYGLVAPVGAEATITLPPRPINGAGPYRLKLSTINQFTFESPGFVIGD